MPVGIYTTYNAICASTENLVLFGNQTVDGVDVTGDGTFLPFTQANIVLVKDQTNPEENGIYIPNTNGAWVRVDTQMTKGWCTHVLTGEVNKNTGWMLTDVENDIFIYAKLDTTNEFFGIWTPNIQSKGVLTTVTDVSNLYATFSRVDDNKCDFLITGTVQYSSVGDGQELFFTLPPFVPGPIILTTDVMGQVTTTSITAEGSILSGDVASNTMALRFNKRIDTSTNDFFIQGSYFASDSVATTLPLPPGFDPGVPVEGTTIIYGILENIDGTPKHGASVQARVLRVPTLQGTLAAVTTETQVVHTNNQGEFILHLITGAEVDIFIPSANFRRTLIVPNITTNLFDIP